MNFPISSVFLSIDDLAVNGQRQRRMDGQFTAAVDPPASMTASPADPLLHPLPAQPLSVAPFGAFYTMPRMLPGSGLATDFLAHSLPPAFSHSPIYAWAGVPRAAIPPTTEASTDITTGPVSSPTPSTLPSRLSLCDALGASNPAAAAHSITFPPPPPHPSEPVYGPPAFVRWAWDIKRTKTTSGKRTLRSRVEKYVGIKPGVPRPRRTSDGRWAIDCPVCGAVQRSNRTYDMERHLDTHFRLPGQGKWECRGVPVELVHEELFRALPKGLREIRSYEDGEYVGGCGKRYTRESSFWRHVRRGCCLAISWRAVRKRKVE
ncbi:hypothetical protein BV20DRAFT_665827 [Pilatotrama ljubarskyi]|nr:hypothetical protein BV20DRAFT_665827 [Pilatotrama ljubarskyi]